MWWRWFCMLIVCPHLHVVVPCVLGVMMSVVQFGQGPA